MLTNRFFFIIFQIINYMKKYVLNKIYKIIYFMFYFFSCMTIFEKNFKKFS